MIQLDENDVLFEDNHLIAINKKNGLLVQGDKTGDPSLIDLTKAFIKRKYNKPGNVFLGLPHRLDRPVSGVVLFAKTSKALSRLSELFRLKKISKTYWAVCCSRPPEESGIIENYLLKNEKNNKSFVVDSGKKGAKPAKLSYTLTAMSANYALVEVDLHTGRHHQIRCQLASVGCIIRGDLKYGAKQLLQGGGIDLHARKLVFVHPVAGKNLEITAPPPKAPLWQYFIE